MMMKKLNNRMMDKLEKKDFVTSMQIWSIEVMPVSKVLSYVSQLIIQVLSISHRYQLIKTTHFLMKMIDYNWFNRKSKEMSLNFMNL